MIPYLKKTYFEFGNEIIFFRLNLFSKSSAFILYFFLIKPTDRVLQRPQYMFLNMQTLLWHLRQDFYLNLMDLHLRCK